jgi:hypothetical protein
MIRGGDVNGAKNEVFKNIDIKINQTNQSKQNEIKLRNPDNARIETLEQLVRDLNSLKSDITTSGHNMSIDDRNKYANRIKSYNITKGNESWSDYVYQLISTRKPRPSTPDSDELPTEEAVDNRTRSTRSGNTKLGWTDTSVTLTPRSTPKIKVDGDFELTNRSTGSPKSVPSPTSNLSRPSASKLTGPSTPTASAQVPPKKFELKRRDPLPARPPTPVASAPKTGLSGPQISDKFSPTGTFVNKQDTRIEKQYSGMTLEATQPFLGRQVIPLATNRSAAQKQSVTPLPPASNTTDLPANIIKLIEEFNAKNSVNQMDVKPDEMAIISDKILFEANRLKSVDTINAIIDSVDKPTLSVSKALTERLESLIKQISRSKPQPVTLSDVKVKALKIEVDELLGAYNEGKRVGITDVFEKYNKLRDYVNDDDTHLLKAKKWLIEAIDRSFKRAIDNSKKSYLEKLEDANAVYKYAESHKVKFGDDYESNLEKMKNAIEELKKKKREKEVEEARLAEELRLAEEARLAEEKRKAEQARLAEEAQRKFEEEKAEEARIEAERIAAEAKRKADDAKKAEAVKRLKEIAAEAEAKRAAEDAKKAKQAEKEAAEEKARLAEEAARVAAEELEKARVEAELAETARVAAVAAAEEAARLEEEKIKSSALDSATSATLVLTQGIDQAVEEKKKTDEEAVKSTILDNTTKSILVISTEIDKAVEEKKKEEDKKKADEEMAALDAATNSTLVVSTAIDKVVEEEAERKRVEEEEAERQKKEEEEAERKRVEEEAERKRAEEEAKAESDALDKATSNTLAVTTLVDDAVSAKAKEEEDERKAKEEAERKAKEEAERKAKEEAERKAKEEAERKAKAKEESDALDGATSNTLAVSKEIDSAIEAKAEDEKKARILDSATQSTLIMSQVIESASKAIQEAITLNGAAKSTLVLSNAIDNATKEQEEELAATAARLEEERVAAAATAAELERAAEQERLEKEAQERKAQLEEAQERKAQLEEELAATRLEEARVAAAAAELAKSQEKARLELEEKIKQEQLTAVAAESARVELAETQNQERIKAEKLEKQKREEATTRLINIQYGWPEEFKDLPVIPVNDIKPYTDLIKLTINSGPDRNYNHAPISAGDIGDQPLPSNLTYLPAGIFDKKYINDAGAIYAALTGYRTILEKAKMKLFNNKITAEEIRQITDKSLTSDPQLNQWIEQKINGRGGAMDKAMSLIS